ncbi:MAG: hypothetical protein ACXWEH_01160 [Actinomycetota bacterium]
MSDLEHDVREMFRRREGDLPGSTPTDAHPVVRRARRRQAGTVAAAALGIALLAAGSFAGLRALRTTERGTPADEPRTTTTINGISITHPEGWTVFDPDELELNGPPNPRPGLPHLVLAVSPSDPGELFGCPGMVEGARPASLMTVQELPLALVGGSRVPWPVALEPLSFESAGSTGIVEGPTGGCYPGWEFLRAGWTASGRTFEARVGFAPDVSGEERAALTAAFESMIFEPAVGDPTSVLIATGTAGGEDWELQAERQAGGLALSLQAETFGTGGDFVPTPGELQFLDHVFGSGADAERLVFGPAPPGTVQIGVRIDPDDELLLAVTDVPDTIDDSVNAFVVTLRPDVAATLVAYDASHDVIATGQVASGSPNATPSPLPNPLPLPDEVLPAHGDTVWGLYLAVGDSLDDPAMHAAVDRATQLGYTPTEGDIACDDGAASALGVPEGGSRVAIYFATEADAAAAANAFADPAPVGIARVTTFCLD